MKFDGRTGVARVAGGGATELGVVPQLGGVQFSNILMVRSMVEDRITPKLLGVETFDSTLKLPSFMLTMTR